MTMDPPEGGSRTTLGVQMAQAWQKGLEAWWQTLLGDRDRLSEFMKRLAELGFGGSNVGGGSGLSDLLKVLRALELLEKRFERLEQKVEVLSEHIRAATAHWGAKTTRKRKPRGSK